METIFENQFIRSKEFYNEFYGYYYFKRSPLIVINSLIAVPFIMGILSIPFPHTFLTNEPTGIYIALPLFIWARNIFKFMKVKKLQYNRELELNQGKLCETKLSVTENEIELLNISIGTKKNINFSQIKNMYKTKNFYMVNTKINQSYVFRKDSFIKGTPEEFENFMRSKGFKC